MRWKIQIFASFVMATLAVMLSLAIARLATGNFSPAIPFAHPARLANLAVLIPAFVASFFVYRRTALERKTQAAITFFLTIGLALATLMLLSRLL